MKILIVSDTYPPHVNGAAQFSYRIVQALVRRGHEVAVIAPSESWRSGRRVEEGVSVTRVVSAPLYVNNMRVALPWLSRRYVSDTVDDFGPDVIHVQGHFGLSRFVVSVVHEKTLPVVGTNHFMPDNLLHYLHLPYFVDHWLNRQFWQWCYGFFAALEVVTTPTHKAAELFVRHGFKKPVQVISNGIDLSRFRSDYDVTALREKYQLSNKVTALVVGRLDKEKNIDVIIRALALVREKLDIHLIVAGSDKGGEARKLKRMVAELGLIDRVTFTGFVADEDLPTLYNCADVFISAGTAELQSIVTMEAMASGLPVIAAEAVALPELVVSGENGYLFEPNNEKELARFLGEICGDASVLAEMGQVSRIRVQEHDLSVVVGKFEDCYKSVMTP